MCRAAVRLACTRSPVVSPVGIGGEAAASATSQRRQRLSAARLGPPAAPERRCAAWCVVGSGNWNGDSHRAWRYHPAELAKRPEQREAPESPEKR